MHGGEGFPSWKPSWETGIPKLKIWVSIKCSAILRSAQLAASVPEYLYRKATLTAGERYITPELKELENKPLAQNERLLMEHQLFADLLKPSRQLLRIQRTAFAVATGCSGFLCGSGGANNYVKPTVDDSDVLSITEGPPPGD